MSSALALAGLSLALDTALAGWILFRGGGAIDARRVQRAILALVILAVPKAIAAKSLPGLESFFLLVHLAYVDLVVLAPAMGLAVLFAARRRAVSQGARALAWTALPLAPIGAWATFVEPFRLQVERAEVAVAREHAPTKPLRIAVLADIQCERVTEYERAAVARALELQPDLVLIPGDLAQVEVEDVERVAQEFRELLAPLHAPLGVWIVSGNVDPRHGVRELLAGTPVQLLDDRIVELEHGGRKVLLGGVGLSFAAPASRAVIDELQQREGDELRILMAHLPDVVEALDARSRVDLVVAGHTHGGQIVLPFFGPPLTLSSVPRAVAAGGLHDLDGRRIYVSRGIGCERGWAPRVRFLCPPEVTWLTVLPEATAQE